MMSQQSSQKTSENSSDNSSTLLIFKICLRSLVRRFFRSFSMEPHVLASEVIVMKLLTKTSTCFRNDSDETYDKTYENLLAVFQDYLNKILDLISCPTHGPIRYSRDYFAPAKPMPKPSDSFQNILTILRVT
jgi:hypothetical protein